VIRSTASAAPGSTLAPQTEPIPDRVAEAACLDSAPRDPAPRNPAPSASADAAAAEMARRVGFGDRMLASAVAAHLHGSSTGSSIDALALSGTDLEGVRDPEQRLVAWAARRPSAAAIAEWLGRWRRVATFCLIAALTALAAIGWFAAQGALGLDRSAPTNVFWLLGGVLLPQTLLLSAWVLLSAVGGAAGAALSLGGLLRAAVFRVAAGRLGADPAAAAAAAALVSAFGKGPIGRWTLGVTTNSLWSAFNLGVLAAVVALLAVQQHTFCWESTILSSEGYRRLTAAIAWLPSTLGFAVPDAEQIAAARLDPSSGAPFLPQDEAARVAWSGLLVGSVVAYGLLPRMLLTALSAAFLGRATRRFRLNLDAPLLAPIAAALVQTRVVRAPEPAAPWPSERAELGRELRAAEGSATTPIGAPSVRRAALVGLELSAPASGWPPAPLTGAGLDDLGRLESREDRHTAIAALRAAAPGRLLVVVAPLGLAPDRGVGALLRELVAAAQAPAALVLTGGRALRARGDSASVSQRSADWRSVAEGAGILAARVVEIDLDLLTASSSAALRAVAEGQDPAGGSRRVEEAFRIIAAAADRWSVALDNGAPSVTEQAALHREIAMLYGAEEERTGLRRLLGVDAQALRDLGALDALRGAASAPLNSTLARAGERFAALLPATLRMQPKWLAAGALAGALGCVAAAMLGPAAIAAPLALQALPIWSGLGAAVGGVFSARKPAAASAGGSSVDRVAEESQRVAGLAAAIRAAALHAIVLELQGGGEARIAESLERAFPAAGEDNELEQELLDTRAPGAARRWLDGVRHRLDLAAIEQSRGDAGEREWNAASARNRRSEDRP
jgi:hypothetical protein